MDQKNLKILLLNNRVPYPLKDGGAIATFNQIQEFCRQGIDLSVFCLNTNKHFVPQKVIDEKFKDCIIFKSSIINTDIKAIPAFINLFSSKSYNVERFENKEAKTTIIQILKENSYDAIIIENLFMMPYFDICKKYSHAPIILRQHNVEHQVWERLASNETKFFKRIYLNHLAKKLKRFEVKSLSKTKQVWAITKEDEKTFSSLNPNGNYKTFPAGFTEEKTQPKIFNSNCAFHIGSLEWEPNVKGITWFIKNVLPIILEKNPKFKFIIAGKGHTSESNKWIGNNIQFVGEIEDSKEFIQSNGIMIVPLFAGSGIRIKILEAMKLRVNVVSTDIGYQGIGKLSDATISIANTPTEFAESILNLNNNPSIREHNTLNSYSFFKNNYLIKNIVHQQIATLKVLTTNE